jgi:hypothetical protein
MTPDDKDAVLDLARANLARADLTPDELPAIEGRVEAFIRWTDPCNTKPFSGSSLQLVSDLRALLKAYQEQRRALERISAVMAGDVETDTLTTATGRLNGVIAIANGAILNQKGDER